MSDRVFDSVEEEAKKEGPLLVDSEAVALAVSCRMYHQAAAQRLRSSGDDRAMFLSILNKSTPRRQTYVVQECYRDLVTLDNAFSPCDGG